MCRNAKPHGRQRRLDARDGVSRRRDAGRFRHGRNWPETRSKNVTHTMAMSLMAFALGGLGYFAVGFALMWGGSGAAATRLGSHAVLDAEAAVSLSGHNYGLFGHEGFFLAGKSIDFGLLALFFSQAVLAIVAVTIPTGAMAERWKFRSFVYYALFMSAVVYPIFGNWVWGGGWLATLGAN